MAPVKNPNNKTGTVPKLTQSGSSSGSSMHGTSPCRSKSSSVAKKPNSQRSNGIVVGRCDGRGDGAVQNLTNTPPATHATHATTSSSAAAAAAPTTIVPQSGGIGAVGGAMSNAFALRKNTEIVAPIRRELKDLNDYFLSVTESPQTSLPSAKRQNHHYHHRHQPPVTPIAAATGPPNNLDNTTCFEIDHFPDNQRSCYPVRPIPRRTSSHPRDNDPFSYHNPPTQLPCSIPTHNNNNNNPNNTQAATVGVVNPTTLDTTSNNDESHAHNSNRYSTNPFVKRHHQPGPSQSHSQGHGQAPTAAGSAVNIDIAEIDELLHQRYKYIQHCINLANKQQNKNKGAMVNENNENEIIVNSASLEDVAASETSERAQSVTSIHSAVSAAEPASPTYEDLQSRLEASTRNIQNMKEQQAQLMRLQDQAKQHLAEMEALRSNTTPLLSSGAAVGQNGAPDYETIDQVHTDMDSLVGRMKNLTTFIAGQNELSNLLGDDGPEILAEQQTLQEKLEGLKTHRDEMKNLIMELHDVNRVAERRMNEQQSKNDDQPSGSGKQKDHSAARVVPVEYSRVVPIELVGAQKKGTPPKSNHVIAGNLTSNGVVDASDEDDEENDPETAALINQKMSDIQAMKAQLARLKSMMETVKLIEERGEGLDPKEIGTRSVEIPVQRESTPKNTNSQQSRAIGAAVPFDKDRTPVQDDFTEEPEDPVITEKINMLNEVTRDLRSQAMSLASERDRIRALKEEIIRRKAESAALNRRQQLAVENDETNNQSLRESVSPMKLSNMDTRRDLLEAQYEEKKKQFQEICARIQSEEEMHAATTSNLQSQMNEIIEREEQAEEEDQDEEEEHVDADANANELLVESQVPTKPDIGFYYPQSQGLSCDSSVHDATNKTLGKESADSGAADVNGAGSVKSGSSRSFSIPPPMRAMNNREASWHFTGAPNTSSVAGSSGPVPAQFPAWNPYYFYNAPYSPHFVQPPSVGVAVSSDCVCQGSSVTLANGTATPAATVIQSDPVLLQQFIQTQQMLINSVCQCNQMLWHQQREIDSLNSTIHMLQERLLSHTNGTDLNATHRSESVPPAGTVQNNLYPSMNRAQSEQPHPFASMHTHPNHMLPNIMSQNNSSFQRRNLCNIQQQQQQQLSNFNFSASAEQQSSGNMYFNNLCAPMAPMHVFNNVNGGPAVNNNAPIFMHHHNNTQHSAVHNNNSNLLNAAQQQQQPQPTPVASVAGGSGQNVSNGSNGASNLAGSALNNQVPPGNRANNYWDNFRSYSRQNLLSSNSCKSNEEQNHNQPQHQHHQSAPIVPQPQHQQQQQQQPQQSQQQPLQQEPPQPALPIFTNTLNSASYRPDSTTNNLNPTTHDNRYQQHSFRNRINAPPLSQQPIAAPATQSTTNYSNMMNISVNQPPDIPPPPQPMTQPPHNWNVAGVSSDVFESNELSQDLRNMNLNFGNNEPNKVAIKPSSFRRPPMYRRLRPTQSGPPSFIGPQQAQQSEGSVADLLSPELFSGVIESLDSTMMDDTSDEIKRNLLVNELKSEKLNLKFYESLKEDVFRRIETLLRAKENEQQFLQHLYRDYDIASTSDPLRKFYLNEVRSLSRPVEDFNDTESNNGENDDDNEDDDDDEQGAQALDNHNILNNNNNTTNEVQNVLGLNAKDIRRLADKFIATGSVPSCSSAAIDHQSGQQQQYPDYELVNFIIARLHEDTQPNTAINEGLLIDVAELTAAAIHNYTVLKCHSSQFAARFQISPKKIYAKLRDRSFPRNRDEFLVWYQRFLENMLFVTLPQQRDDEDDEDPRPSRENNNYNKENTNQNAVPGAMSWMDIQNLYINAHQVRKSNIPFRSRASGSSGRGHDGENKIENNSSFRQQQRSQNPSPRAPTGGLSAAEQHHLAQQIPTSMAVMNEDLAEADQVCSSSSNTLQGFVENHDDDSFLLGGGALAAAVVEPLPPPTPDNAEGQLISIPLDFFLDETENNENPDDDENRPHHLSIDVGAGAAAVVHPVVDSDNAEEDADGQNQRPESSLHGAFGTDPLAIGGISAGGGANGKRNSVP